METLKVILAWLSGKKSIILGLITTTTAYLVTVGEMSNDLALYINAMALLIFGSASVATGKLLYPKK